MLKITIHDSPEALTFQVEGKLIGDWAKELEAGLEDSFYSAESESINRRSY